MRARSAVLGALLLLASPLRAEDTPVDPGARTPETVRGAPLLLDLAVSFPVGSAGGYAMDVSRDGKLIGVGGRFGDLVFLSDDPSKDAPKDVSRRAIHPYSNAVESLSFSPDGKRCVTGALDGGVIVWDLATMKPLWRTPGTSAAAWSPDGKTIAHGMPDADHLVLIDAETYAERARFAIDEVDRRIERLRFSPDSKSVVLGTGEGSVVVCDAATGERRQRVVLQSGQPVYAVAMLADGRTAAGGRKGAVRIGETTFTLPGGVASLAVSPDGTRLVIGGNREGALTEVDLKTMERRTLLEKGTAPWVGALAFSSDGRALHWIGDGGPLSSLRDGKVTKTPVGAEAIRNLAFSKDGRHVAASAPNGVSFGHVADGTSTPVYFYQPRFGNGGSAHSVVAAGRAGAEFALLRGPELVLYDGASGREAAAPVKIAPEPYPIFQGAWGAPDGSFVIAAAFVGATSSVALPGGRATELPTGFLHALDVAWSPDGKRVAMALVGGHHGEFQEALLGKVDGGRIDFAKGKLLERRVSGMVGDEDSVGPPWSTAFSPSGKRHVVADSTGTIEVDPATREEVRRTRAQFMWLRFLDEETALASSGENVVLWDTKSDAGTVLLKHPDLREWALSPDRSSLAVASQFRVFVYRIARQR